MSGNAARAKAIAAGVLVSTAGIYAGYSLRETAGAAATVRLWDGAAASGTQIATIALAANGSRDVGIPHGVWFTGLFIEIVTGTVEGSIYIS
jgi:hypothetical protein